jgi:hypothetical protein
MGKKHLLAAATVAAALAATTATAAASDLSRARAGTAGFHNNAAAQSAEYGEFVDAEGIACIEDDEGGMGIHYVNGGLLDAVVDAAKPEALVYAPMKNGRLRLVANEYIVFQDAWDLAHAPAGTHAPPPRLFGRDFELVPEFIAPNVRNRYGLPAFWELHAWVWEHNPLGMFNDWNPRVSCG